MISFPWFRRKKPTPPSGVRRPAPGAHQRPVISRQGNPARPLPARRVLTPQQLHRRRIVKKIGIVGAALAAVGLGWLALRPSGPHTIPGIKPNGTEQPVPNGGNRTPIFPGPERNGNARKPIEETVKPTPAPQVSELRRKANQFEQDIKRIHKTSELNFPFLDGELTIGAIRKGMNTYLEMKYDPLNYSRPTWLPGQGDVSEYLAHAKKGTIIQLSRENSETKKTESMFMLKGEGDDYFYLFLNAGGGIRGMNENGLLDIVLKNTGSGVSAIYEPAQ